MLLLLLVVQLFTEPVDPVSTLQAFRAAGKEGIFRYGNAGQSLECKEHQNNFKEVDPNNVNRITYEFSGGRLGDCLLIYTHALWASMKSGIPIYFRNFNQANLFKFFPTERTEFKSTKKTHVVANLELLNPHARGITYAIPYFPECQQEYEAYTKHYGLPFYIDWQDPAFKQALKAKLAPQNPPQLLQKPSGRKSVAIHWRDGGNFDDFEDGRKYYPLKFLQPPFFVESLKTITAIYENEPLFVYIFTDHLNPPQLVDYMRKQFEGKDIVFDGGCHHPIDDFFSIATFDCLIRGMSNFSVMAGFYGDPELILSATRSHREGFNTVIDEHTVYFSFPSP